MKKLIFVAVMALLSSFGAVAQVQNTEIEIVKDVEITQEYRDTFAKLFALTTDVNTLKETLYTTMKASIGSRVPDETLKGMCSELAEVMYPDLYEATLSAYAEIFDLKDIKNLYKFYQTPTGNKLAKNQAYILNVTSQYMQNPETQQKMMPVIMKYMK